MNYKVIIILSMILLYISFIIYENHHFKGEYSKIKAIVKSRELVYAPSGRFGFSHFNKIENWSIEVNYKINGELINSTFVLPYSMRSINDGDTIEVCVSKGNKYNIWYNSEK